MSRARIAQPLALLCRDHQHKQLRGTDSARRLRGHTCRSARVSSDDSALLLIPNCC